MMLLNLFNDSAKKSHIKSASSKKRERKQNAGLACLKARRHKTSQYHIHILNSVTANISTVFLATFKVNISGFSIFG